MDCRYGRVPSGFGGNKVFPESGGGELVDDDHAAAGT